MDRCHNFWPTYSIDVIVGGKQKGIVKESYRVFPDVNRTGRPKAVTSIPIFLGQYRQVHSYIIKIHLYFKKDVHKVKLVRVRNTYILITPPKPPSVEKEIIIRLGSVLFSSVRICKKCVLYYNY